MKIGIISDTHNHLDPQIAGIFSDVSHILHAGDVGMPWILLELEQIAPVTAVLGNTDAGITLRETEVRELNNRTILIQHIVDPANPSEQLQKRVLKLQPDIVVFGHTHRVFLQSIDGTLFFNPGYAGKPRFAQPRSVAVLHVGEKDLTPEIIPL